MLRVSAQQTDNDDLNLLAVTERDQERSGVEGGQALLAFAEAAVIRSDHLPEARLELHRELGEQAVLETAAVVGNFERMTRIADATGIPLDERNLEFTRDLRETLQLQDFASARLP